MNAILLRVVLQGLIALVPNHDTDSATMIALLVDTHNIKPPDMTCYKEHKPEIRFPTSDQECTAAAPKCKLDSPGICLCSLSRNDISILPQITRDPNPPRREPLRSLPFNKAEAGDFAYVANLSRLNYAVDPAFLPEKPSAAPPPAPEEPPVAPPLALAARFQFPYETVAACGLATRSDDGADYVHPLNMRPLGEKEKANEMSQAMAQRVEVTVSIKVDELAGQALKLRLSPFPGEAGKTHDFSLPTDLAEVEIELLNERPHYPNPDHICDDGLGRDFPYFYELVKNKPAWELREVPHVKYSLAKSITDLYPPPGTRLCKRGKAPMSHPICPMASFNP